jgi:uncharacterized protein
MQPRLSAELFTIPVANAFLVYAPLRQSAFLTNAQVVNRLADLQEGRFDPAAPGADELLQFLRGLEIVDADPEARPITTYQGLPKPTMVTLFLTTACNLRCTYCYASAGDTPTRVMPLEVAQRGIDFVLANAVELGASEIEVAYHGGGEPSVNWKTLTGSYDYAVERASAAGVQLRTALASNGVMPDAKIDWIIEHLDGASLSFDGLPEVHDKHRVSLLGGGSAAEVMHTIRRFDEANFDYALRLTVTRENIPKMEASVRFICERFRPRHIQVEPAYQLGRWRDAPSAETADFIAGFRAAQAAAREHGQEIQFSGARLGMLSNHFCGITQDSFCLTADGNVSACYETFLEEAEWAKTFFYGDFDEAQKTFRFALPVLDHLRHQSVENRAFCQGCYAKWTCGGDCYHKSLTVNGADEFQGSDRCHIIRELTKDQILERIAASGGLFWHEPPSETLPAQGKEMLL